MVKKLNVSSYHYESLLRNLKYQMKYMLCISTSFGLLRTPESWSNYFFQPFSTFFIHWFHTWNQWKLWKMNKMRNRPKMSDNLRNEMVVSTISAFRCVQHPKAGWITQQIYHYYYFKVLMSMAALFVWDMSYQVTSLHVHSPLVKRHIINKGRCH